MGRRRRERAFTVPPALRDANTGTAPLAACVFPLAARDRPQSSKCPDPKVAGTQRAGWLRSPPTSCAWPAALFDTMHANACIGLAASQIWVHASSTRTHGARGPLVHRAGWHGGGHSLEVECRKLDPLEPRSDGNGTIFADLWPIAHKP